MTHSDLFSNMSVWDMVSCHPVIVVVNVDEP